MDKELKKLIDQQKVLLDKAKNEGRTFTDEERTLWNDLQTKIVAAKEQIKAEADFAANGEFANQPAGTPTIIVTDEKPVRVYKNLIEQLVSVKAAAKGIVDERLTTLNVALGMNEGAGQDGGFAVQSDFAGAIMDTAVKEDPVLSRVDSYQISQKSDRVSYLEVDETDISSTVFGGVQMHWASEAGEVEASKPKFKEKELKLQKAYGICICDRRIKR